MRTLQHTQSTLPDLVLTNFLSFFFSVFVSVFPQPGRHRRPMTAPKTHKDRAPKRKKVLLTVLTVVVLLGILATAAYFSESQYLKVLFSSKDIHIHHLASYFHQP